ncbi:hypothetical protein CEXT_642951 [Caerostris extrusa]|uniref:Uncharacterized protein n=1 Tax=Caerostris extrusa TaxID=172846 RepID=A0AAV4WYQ7_CAEEX|nr:hypothetical protein CEXT_642951 [Caerostris extrusa]
MKEKLLRQRDLKLSGTSDHRSYLKITKFKFNPFAKILQKGVGFSHFQRRLSRTELSGNIDSCIKSTHAEGWERGQRKEKINRTREQVQNEEGVKKRKRELPSIPLNFNKIEKSVVLNACRKESSAADCQIFAFAPPVFACSNLTGPIESLLHFLMLTQTQMLTIDVFTFFRLPPFLPDEPEVVPLFLLFFFCGYLDGSQPVTDKID